VVLLRACLASIPICLMSLIRFSKWAIEAINSPMTIFLWDDHGISIDTTCLTGTLWQKQKEFGGLGIPDLRDLNLCLLAAWIQRYYDPTPKLWKDIVEQKYKVDSPNLFCCDDRQGSPFWKGVMWTTEAAKMGYKWKIGNGRKVKFWEDLWFDTCSLTIQY
jgi:hypothetical protein